VGHGQVAELREDVIDIEVVQATVRLAPTGELIVSLGGERMYSMRHVPAGKGVMG
jgi:hypothetical protein